MEHPHDPYHLRPFPQQPKRGGKEYMAVLEELESTLGGSEAPDLEKLQLLQERLHLSANLFNDDQLVDMTRTLSEMLENYRENKKPELLQQAVKQILKLRLSLKHLSE